VKNLQALQRCLHTDINDEKLLTLALTHRSYSQNNNERLEFLGDSLLNCIIADKIYHQFPEAKEGQLSRLRAQLVKGDTLAKIAQELSLSNYLIMGEGELKSGGSHRSSVLADVLEAIIGAAYLSGGMVACQDIIGKWFKSRLALLSLDQSQKDPKTCLQELMQARRQPLPQYRVVKISGAPHERSFTIECTVNILDTVTQATAPSRRIAERLAADKVLSMLEAR
jgi:ribonuclease III